MILSYNEDHRLGRAKRKIKEKKEEEEELLHEKNSWNFF
jgi:hypothetical protein